MAPASALRWAAYAGPNWTPTPTQWMQLLELQDGEEKARIKRFHFERDAKMALMGRLMLHAAACAVLGADYSQVPICKPPEAVYSYVVCCSLLPFIPDLHCAVHKRQWFCHHPNLLEIDQAFERLAD